MKIVIDISEHDKSVIDEMTNGEVLPDTTESNIVKAIQNGTPLPEGHGRLIDADDVTDFEGHYITTDAPTIIEADKTENKEYGVKVINRGNCVLCGKKLTEGLLFCKECEAKGK